MIAALIVAGLAVMAPPTDTTPSGDTTPPGDYQPATAQVIDPAHNEPIPSGPCVLIDGGPAGVFATSLEPCSAPLPDDCLVTDGNTGSTRWSMMPCTVDIGEPAFVDIGQPVAVERSQHNTATPVAPSLPATGMKLDIAIIAALLIALGLTLKACGRQYDSEGGWTK